MAEEARENSQAEEQSSVTSETPAAENNQEPEHTDALDTTDAGSACEIELADLQAKLAEAERKAAEYLDGWQRAQAAFANFRKRAEAEQANWRAMANAALLSRILPVMDDFRRAFDALPGEFEGHAWLDGIGLIRRKLQGILDAENVQQIDASPGVAFDPMIHQAILYQAVEGFEEGQVVAEIEGGYMLGDRVLRPATVVVAKAPAAATEPVADETSAEDAAAAVSDLES